MARYDYSCEKCGKMELEHSINDSVSVCPLCGSSSIKKLFTGGAFVLNGGGWYKDGYTKGGSK